MIQDDHREGTGATTHCKKRDDGMGDLNAVGASANADFFFVQIFGLNFYFFFFFRFMFQNEMWTSHCELFSVLRSDLNLSV